MGSEMLKSKVQHTLVLFFSIFFVVAQTTVSSGLLYAISPRNGKEILLGSLMDEIELEVEVVDFELGIDGVLCGELDGQDLGCYEEPEVLRVGNVEEGEHTLLWYLSHYRDPAMDSSLEVPFSVKILQAAPVDETEPEIVQAVETTEEKGEAEELNIDWRTIVQEITRIEQDLLQRRAEQANKSAEIGVELPSPIPRTRRAQRSSLVEQIYRRLQRYGRLSWGLSASDVQRICSSSLPATLAWHRSKVHHKSTENVLEKGMRVTSFAAIDSFNVVEMAMKHLLASTTGSSNVTIKTIVSTPDDAIRTLLQLIAASVYVHSSCGLTSEIKLVHVDGPQLDKLLSQFRRKLMYQSAPESVTLVFEAVGRYSTVIVYPFAVSELNGEVQETSHWKDPADVFDFRTIGLSLPESLSVFPGLYHSLRMSEGALILSNLETREYCDRFDLFQNIVAREYNSSGVLREDKLLVGCHRFSTSQEERDLCLGKLLGIQWHCHASTIREMFMKYKLQLHNLVELPLFEEDTLDKHTVLATLSNSSSGNRGTSKIQESGDIRDVLAHAMLSLHIVSQLD